MLHFLFVSIRINFVQSECKRNLVLKLGGGGVKSVFVCLRRDILQAKSLNREIGPKIWNSKTRTLKCATEEYKDKTALIPTVECKKHSSQPRSTSSVIKGKKVQVLNFGMDL